MTDDTMNLQALLGKSADADFLREMIGFAAQRLMDLEVASLTGAVSIGVQKGPPIGVQKGPPSSSSVTGITGAPFALVAA